MYNLVGMKFSHLTVIEFAGVDKYGGRIWRCVCDCGKERIYQTTLLNKAKRTSCGDCKFRKSSKRKGMLKGEAGRNELYAQYRHQAKKRDIYFNISKKNFALLTSSNCYYCGKPPKYIMNIGKNTKYYREHNEYIYNGVDRVDNRKGYIISNCVPCCHICNALKRDIPISMARKILEFIDRVEV